MGLRGLHAADAGAARWSVFPARGRLRPAWGQRPAQKPRRCPPAGPDPGWRLSQDPVEAAANTAKEVDLLPATPALGSEEKRWAPWLLPGRPACRWQPQTRASAQRHPQAQSAVSAHQPQAAKFLEITFHNFSEALLAILFPFRKHSTEIGHEQLNTQITHGQVCEP